MSNISRRRFIEVGASAAAAAPAVPGASVEAATTPSSLRDIDRFIILMQENRSFDHYFGTLSGVRGYGDAKALRLDNGRSVF